MLVLAVSIYYLKSSEEKSEQFNYVQSYISKSSDVVQKVGNIEEVELIPFKKGFPGGKTNTMYKVGIKGSKKDAVFFIYMSETDGIWNIKKISERP